MGPEQCLDFQRFACLVFFVAASNIVLDSCGIIDGERCVRESAALQDNTDLRYRVESLPHTASQTGGEWQAVQDWTEPIRRMLREASRDFYIVIDSRRSISTPDTRFLGTLLA